jgi:hypothetical protein
VLASLKLSKVKNMDLCVLPLKDAKEQENTFNLLLSPSTNRKLCKNWNTELTIRLLPSPPLF